MERVNCPVCGEPKSKAGMVGHMRWKHGKEYDAPLFKSPHKPYITKLEERVAMLEQRAKQGEAEKELPLGGEVSMPSVQEFMEHCQSCESHRYDLRQWLEKEVDKLTISDLIVLLRARGATIGDLMPERIEFNGTGAKSAAEKAVKLLDAIDKQRI